SQILSSLLLPFRSPSSLISIRFDAWLPVIFENGETPKPFDAEIYAGYKCKKRKKLSEFSLNLTPIHSRFEANDRLFTEINSDCLKIGVTCLAVSRELLSLHSDFFSNLFYGEFMERNQEVKEIKDISEPEFVSFLASLHLRRYEFHSVASALDVLSFADRFLMPKISKMVLPYLKTQTFPKHLLEHAIVAADRVHNNAEIMAWILSQFSAKAKVLEILHSILPSISPATSQMCLEVGLQHISELEKDKFALKTQTQKIVADYERRCANLTMTNLQNQSKLDKEKKISAELMTRHAENMSAFTGPNKDAMMGFHLRCYGGPGQELEFEDYFCADCGIDRVYGSMGRIVNSALWTHVPAEYNSVEINGRRYTRGDSIF
ncbi:hypothetical protein PFISCL1PPCAC_25578, partial [Pristionchus fissidentatus]